MVKQTNLNAAQVCSNGNFSNHARVKQWIDTSRDEMTRFIGLLIWMGLVSMPKIASYWQSMSLYKNSIASATMTRNRFQLLLKMLHFADNEAVQPGDRLHKVSALLTMLVSKFSSAKQPGECLA